MIEISISRELATEHPEFMAGCAKRSHRVEVFDYGQTGDQAPPDPAGRRAAAGATLPAMPSRGGSYGSRT